MNRPASEPGFRLDRQEANDRHIRYTLHPYAVEQPPASGTSAGTMAPNGSRGNP